MNSIVTMIKDFVLNKICDLYENNKNYLSLEFLRVYFDVTNSYVFHKLKIIVFPFLVKEQQWKRMSRSSRPKSDLQAPDLYIPLMFFMNFIVISGYHQGQLSRFKPDVIKAIFSKHMLMWICESFCLRAIIIRFKFGNPDFLELFCYTGYKFVTLVIIILGRVIGNLCLANHGQRLIVSNILMIIFGSMYCYFFHCTLRQFLINPRV